MVRSYSNVLYKLEKEKFKKKVQKINRGREDKRMRELEQLKRYNKRRILQKPKNPEFEDRHQRLKTYLDNSVFKLQIDASKLGSNEDRSKNKVKKIGLTDQHYLLRKYRNKNRQGCSSHRSTISKMSQKSKQNFSKVCEEIELWDIKQASKSTLALKRKLKRGLLDGVWGNTEYKWEESGIRKLDSRRYSDRDPRRKRGKEILEKFVNQRLRQNMIN